jgi:hypothetical protein
MTIECLTVESGRCPTDLLEYLPYSARIPSTQSKDVLDPPTKNQQYVPSQVLLTLQSLTSFMTKAALSRDRTLNFWHILLLALVEVDEDSAVASLIGVAEVSPLGVKGWVSASLQHSFSRLATSCLSSFFKQ